jgi:hypothetical protein
MVEWRAMGAPQYVPNTLNDQPRRGLDIPAPGGWTSDRPGEIGGPQPVGRQMGRPGPDQGFALRLVRQFEDRLQVVAPESKEDAIVGCLGVALARASIFGRAPVVHDLDLAFRIWGFLGDAPEELVRLRRPLFEAVAHHYDDQRVIADHVPEATLRLSHTDVATRFPSEWRDLLGLA